MDARPQSPGFVYLTEGVNETRETSVEILVPQSGFLSCFLLFALFSTPYRGEENENQPSSFSMFQHHCQQKRDP